MNRIRITAILLPLLAFTAASQTADPANLDPACPKNRDKIGFTYNAAHKSAPLHGAQSVTLELLVMRKGGYCDLRRIPMRREDSVWKCSFALTDPGAALLLYQFDSGLLVDDNGGDCRYCCVYGEDGTPVQDAHYLAAKFIRHGEVRAYRHAGNDTTVTGVRAFKHSVNRAAVLEELERELKLYPMNLPALGFLWFLQLESDPSDSMKTRIEMELEKLYDGHKHDVKVLAFAHPWFDQLGLKKWEDRFQSNPLISRPWIDKDTENLRLDEINQERDDARRTRLIEKFISDYPLMAPSMRSSLVNAHINAGNFHHAADLLRDSPEAEQDDYAYLARVAFMRDTLLDAAFDWAKKGAAAIRKALAEGNPRGGSSKKWREERESSMAQLNLLYVRALFKVNKSTLAEKPASEAYELFQGEDPLVNGHYLACLVKNGKFEKAIETGVDCIRRNKYDSGLLIQLKKAYVAVHGSAIGFLDTLTVEFKNARALMKSKFLEGRLDEPAPDFTLRDLDGNAVHLEDLKGKVVLLDFWATWCGPCAQSFPAFQTFYNLYKSNDSVRFFAVNCWEKTDSSKRDKLVRGFLALHSSRIPVLYDDGIAEQYGVKGIPTTIVIDRRGRIQFRNAGFEGEQQLIDELGTQIELLLGKDFYSRE